MRIYFACPAKQRREYILKHGHEFGACLTRDVFNKLTASAMHWFFDNGAFSDSQTGKDFNFHKFTKRLLQIESLTRFGRLPMPDFVVIPDKVGDEQSLRYSKLWLPYLNQNFPYFNYFLAVQNGMESAFNMWKIERMLMKKEIDGLFVGGNKEWKYKTGKQWVELAKEYNVPIHCGGIGTRKNILWAKHTGFTSVDSGVAMIHPKHLDEVLNIKNELLWMA